MVGRGRGGEGEERERREGGEGGGERERKDREKYYHRASEVHPMTSELIPCRLLVTSKLSHPNRCSPLYTQTPHFPMAPSHHYSLAYQDA